MDDMYDDFWGAFLEETGTPENTYLNRVTYFGEDWESSCRIMEEYLFGERKAISHCIPWYLVTRTPMPKVGDYTMVTDFYGNPCLVLRTRDVIIAPIPEIPEEIARLENQGDLAAWREKKKEEFQAMAKKSTFHYNDENPILMEIVEVLYPEAETR